MKLITIITALIIVLSCTKETDRVEDCQRACLLSDKFAKDSVYVRTDTLWQDNVCGPDLLRLKKEKDVWFTICETETTEHWYYLFNNILK